MIARLTGKLVSIGLDEVVVDVRGVGYHVHVPVGTQGRVKPDDEGLVTLTIHTAVREDAIQLFGFASEQEKAVYRKLISVSGVGPRLGLNVLSDLSVSEIVGAIRSEDFRPFTRVSGIGKKTAQRLLLELRNAFDDLPVALDVAAAVTPPGGTDATVLDDLRSALVNLQYHPTVIESVIPQIAPLADEGEDLQALVRQALKLLRS